MHFCGPSSTCLSMDAHFCRRNFHHPRALADTIHLVESSVLIETTSNNLSRSKRITSFKKISIICSVIRQSFYFIVRRSSMLVPPELRERFPVLAKPSIFWKWWELRDHHNIFLLDLCRSRSYKSLDHRRPNINSELNLSGMNGFV